MKVLRWLGPVVLPWALWAQAPVNLPEFIVNSPRVANQAAASTFVMPVSALRFEPLVDVQARNSAEGQSDVTLRGGIFENTGFQLGASTVLDPQTGHYFAEIPVAPALLRAPEVITGARLALAATNSTVGAISYAWRPIRTQGAVWLGAGEHGMNRQELYQGYRSTVKLGGLALAGDIALARSESRGPVAFGDHHFERVNGRVQLAGPSGQTDFFAGYQAKFFGWPNLYTPFNSNETEDIETVLFTVNHRAEFGAGDFLEAGAYYRRNKDDYAFNRFAPVGPVHPFQHTTWVRGGAGSLRRSLGGFVLNARAEVLQDELQSTSLTFGRFHTRTITKVSLVPEKTWASPDGSRVTVRAGAAFDDTNRDVGRLSPVLELSRDLSTGPVRRLYVSYAGTSQVATYTALNSNAAAGLFRGNPNLRREKSRNVEVGVSGMFADWTAQAAAFWRSDDDLVDWTYRRGVTARTANAVDVEVAGVELVARRSWRAFDLVLGYTLLGKDADYGSAAVDASFYALNYARQRLTAALTARLPQGFEIRMDNVARAQAANPLRTVGGNEAVTSTLGLAYRSASLPGLEVSVQAENLWDTDFQDVPAVPATPRQWSAGLSYHW
jgi:outer membrane receptor protein involved in Fe transport